MNREVARHTGEHGEQARTEEGEPPWSPTQPRSQPSVPGAGQAPAPPLTAGTALATALGATALASGPGVQQQGRRIGRPNATVTLAQGIDDAASTCCSTGDLRALRGVSYASISQRLALPAGEHARRSCPRTVPAAAAGPVGVDHRGGARRHFDLAVAARPAADGGGGVVSVQETDLSALPAFTTRIRWSKPDPGGDLGVGDQGDQQQHAAGGGRAGSWRVHTGSGLRRPHWWR
ncbi:MAG: hypothetical protein R2749_05200 [Acidimicrobiales bacterium]